MPDSPRRTTVPRSLPSEIKRTHLLKLLRKSDDHRLIALLAPSGFGKTTLLAQYARNSRHQVVWIPLAFEDGDLLVFLRKLLSYLQLHNILPSLNINLQELNTMALEHVQVLIRQHLSDLRQHVQIFLDKTEFLSEDGGKWLSSLIQKLPEGHQIFLAGYENSSLPISTWLTWPDVLMIGPTQLSFTEKEAKAFVTRTGETWNADFYQQTQGWPVAFSLKTAGNPVGLDAVDWILTRLRTLPENLQSRLPQLIGEPEWFDQVQLPDGSRLESGWISILLSAGLPLTRMQKNAYAPHTLLISALDRLLRQTPELHEMIHRHYASRAEKQNNDFTALDHLLRIPDVDSALQVAHRLVQTLLNRSDIKSILTVLSRFQEKDLPPDLLSFLAFGHNNTGNFEQGQLLAERLHQQGYEDALVCLVLSNGSLRQSNQKMHLHWAVRGLEISTNVSITLPLHRMKIAALHYAQQLDEALQECRIYLTRAQSTRSPFQIAKAFTVMGNVYSDMGRTLEGQQAYRNALQIVREHQLDSMKGDLFYNLSMSLADLNQPLESLSLLNEALSAPRETLGSWYPLLVGARGTIYHQLKMYREAIQEYQKASELAPQVGWDSFTFIYILAIADSACMQGDFALAEATLARARLNHQEDAIDQKEFLAFSESLFAVSTQNHQEALELLSAADDPVISLWNWSLIPFLQAEIARREGLLTREHLDGAFRRLDSFGNDGPLQAMSGLLEQLYQECIAHDWYRDRLLEVLARGREPIELPTPGWELQIKTLGQFEVHSPRGRLQLSLKKCEELLVYLVLHGPCTRDQIIDALWNGQMTKQITDHFKVLIRKLRLELGQHLDLPFEAILYEKGFYQFHESLELVCDASSLFDPASNPVEIHDLYGGDFFPRLESEWAELFREKCRERFVDLALHFLTELPEDMQEEHLKAALQKVPDHHRLLIQLESQVQQ